MSDSDCKILYMQGERDSMCRASGTMYEHTVLDSSEIRRENHLGCIKPNVNTWDKLYTYQLDQDIFHQQYDLICDLLRNFVPCTSKYLYY